MSTDFPVFTVAQDRLAPAFLDWMSKTKKFVNLCRAASEGTTNRVRLKEEKFLAMSIPLPPLREQRRIVARIETLAAKIAEARGLRRQAMNDFALLMPSAIDRRLMEREAKDTTVEAVAHSVTDGDHLPPPKADKGIPFIFISNVVGGTVDLSNCKWVSPEYYENLAPSRVAKRGDVSTQR